MHVTAPKQRFGKFAAQAWAGRVSLATDTLDPSSIGQRLVQSDEKAVVRAVPLGAGNRLGDMPAPDPRHLCGRHVPGGDLEPRLRPVMEEFGPAVTIADQRCARAEDGPSNELDLPRRRCNAESCLLLGGGLEVEHPSNAHLTKVFDEVVAIVPEFHGCFQNGRALGRQLFHVPGCFMRRILPLLLYTRQ